MKQKYGYFAFMGGHDATGVFKILFIIVLREGWGGQS